MVTSVDSPEPSSSGAESWGARKSGEDDVIPNTTSGQLPLLLMVSGSSTNEPTHAAPMFPLSAMAIPRFAVPWNPVAARSTTGAAGSLLVIRMVATSKTPATVGLYTTVNSISSPAASTSGVAGVGSTVKSVDPIRRCTLSINRSAEPTLYTSRLRYCGPLQTDRKSTRL